MTNQTFTAPTLPTLKVATKKTGWACNDVTRLAIVALFLL